eukprot:5938237-Pyramimonas_sp.AAC.1
MESPVSGFSWGALGARSGSLVRLLDRPNTLLGRPRAPWKVFLAVWVRPGGLLDRLSRYEHARHEHV